MKEEKNMNIERMVRVVAPITLQRRIVHKLSHAGRFGAFESVRQKHWFRGMKSMIVDVVMKEILAPDERSIKFGDRWHIDHPLIATDIATKYVVLCPAKKETAQAATDILLELCTRFGTYAW